jgi:hypothetical protein
MSFEMEPSDEPCPDCGSTQHRSCMKILMTVGDLPYSIAPKVWFTGLDYRDCVPERWERL